MNWLKNLLLSRPTPLYTREVLSQQHLSVGSCHVTISIVIRFIVNNRAVITMKCLGVHVNTSLTFNNFADASTQSSTDPHVARFDLHHRVFQTAFDLITRCGCEEHALKSPVTQIFANTIGVRSG